MSEEKQTDCDSRLLFWRDWEWVCALNKLFSSLHRNAN